MLVTIDQALFTSQRVAQCELVALLHLGFEGRHIILTDPSYTRGAQDQLSLWIEQLRRGMTALAEEMELTLVDGLKRATK